MMVRFMVVIGFLSFIVSGCSSEPQSTAELPEHQERNLPATDVDTSKAVPAGTYKPAEIHADADGASIKLYLYAEQAISQEQRAQTAMKEALDVVVNAGIRDSLVWLYNGKTKDQAELVAVAIYDPDRFGVDPWDVMAAGADGDRVPYYGR